MLTALALPPVSCHTIGVVKGATRERPQLAETL